MKAIFRFLVWQIISRIYKYPILLPYAEKSHYLCWNGLTGLTGNWYYGLIELEEMSFDLHFLRKEDCFYDIGSNVGAFTILASQHSECEVHAFEPVPSTFASLERNVKIQQNQNSIFLYNVAVGESAGIIKFTNDQDTVNHVATDGKINIIKVEVVALDELSINPPTCIKIDVEGFEWNVLQGATSLLKQSGLNAIIIELNGSGIRYGVDDYKIDTFLRGHGFEPYTYNPFSRNLIKLKQYTSHNTIYIRDYNFCKERCLNGEKFKLRNGAEL